MVSSVSTEYFNNLW